MDLANGTTSNPSGSFEYFNEDGERDAKGYGEFNKHGNDSWAFDQRGLDWITRDEMGYARHVKERFFKGSNRSKFQRLILRPEGNDNYTGSFEGAHMRDMYVHTIAEEANMSLDVRRSEKVVIYLDGSYWGVYSIREKVDDHDYTDYYYGQGKYDIQVIKTWGSTWAEYGGAAATADWNALHNYILTTDLSIQANFDYVDSLLDVKSVADYMLLNSYVVSSDWLVWNTGWWRGLDPAGGHQKWGYLLWDNDNTFGFGVNWTGIPNQEADADPCFQDSLVSPASDPEGHSLMLRSLRANEGFDNYYVSRYADLMNSAFTCDSMLFLLDSIVTHVAPEMARHCTRWGGTHSQWMDNVDTLRQFILDRCPAVSTGIADCYSLAGPYNVKFNVDPPGAGEVNINSLTVSAFTFSADYYDGLPINLEALETNPAFEFDHWELVTHTVTPDDTTIAVELNITGVDSVVAHFTPVDIVTSNNQSTFSELDIKVFPNPFSDLTNIVIKGKTTAAQVHVYDLLGQRVQTVSPSQRNQFQLNRNEMTAGMYLFTVTNEAGEVIGDGKIMVE